MEPSERVFKFPDGKGGNIFKIQSKDGQWLDCDKDGNIISAGVEEKGRDSVSRPAARRKRSDSPSPSTGIVNMTISLPKDIADNIEDYLGWLHRKTRRPYYRSTLVVAAMTSYIKADKEYQKDCAGK